MKICIQRFMFCIIQLILFTFVRVIKAVKHCHLQKQNWTEVANKYGNTCDRRIELKILVKS